MIPQQSHIFRVSSIARVATVLVQYSIMDRNMKLWLRLKMKREQFDVTRIVINDVSVYLKRLSTRLPIKLERNRIDELKVQGTWSDL